MSLKKSVVNFRGGIAMSARWRRTVKNRKWLEIKEFAKQPKKQKSDAKAKNRTSNAANFRPLNSYIKRKFEEPKPLIDIFQDNNNITIIAEIAGFNKETFKISVKDQKITLSAKSKERRYYKSLNLPKVVIPDETHTKYKNGVQESSLKSRITTLEKRKKNAT